MNKTAHTILRFIIRLILLLIARVEVTGFDNLPDAQGYVIAANHIGRLDAALPYYILDRPDIIVIVAEKYQKHAFTRWLTKVVNGIFIDRYNADVGALRQTLRRLQSGGILTMTPEGTRSKSGNLIEAKPGGIFLAWKAGVPILPAALTGTEDAVVRNRLKHFKRLSIKVIAGKPFTLPPVEGKDRDELMQQYTDEVMCRIAVLLPEGRRGFYAGHPKLKKLLETKS
ncbi:MAG: lysophospholipid acyltransferase family protein [Chloroflexota bacterium]